MADQRFGVEHVHRPYLQLCNNNDITLRFEPSTRYRVVVVAPWTREPKSRSTTQRWPML
jgi:hypothetical protein